MDQAPSPSRRRRVPTLECDDAVSEVILRLPPDQPVCLVRASHVCKSWRKLVSDREFLRHYRAFHQTPPLLLGFFQNPRFMDWNDPVHRFVPVVEYCPLARPDFNTLLSEEVSQYLFRKKVLDGRHGRVLVLDSDRLTVWDPITGVKHQLPAVPQKPYRHDYKSGAVMCDVLGCDHRNCHAGSFCVVFAGTESGSDDSVNWVSMYTSVARAWTAPVGICSGPIRYHTNVMGPSRLAGDGVFFILEMGLRILRFGVNSGRLSVIPAAPIVPSSEMFLTTGETAELGAAGVVNFKLQLWSWHSIDQVWVQDRVIDLDLLIPMSLAIGTPETNLGVIGFAEQSSFLFVTASSNIFMLNLKTGTIETICDHGTYLPVLPFMLL